MIKRISKKVTHQGIGGKEFIIDEEITKTLNPSEIWNQCDRGNIACLNFTIRREDFDPIDDKDLNFPHKLYYVKVDGIGYIIAEDEIETVMEPGDINPADIKLPGTDGLPNSGGVGGACASAMVAPVIEDTIKPMTIGIDFGQVINSSDLLKNIESSNRKNSMFGGRE